MLFDNARPSFIGGEQVAAAPPPAASAIVPNPPPAPAAPAQVAVAPPPIEEGDRPEAVAQAAAKPAEPTIEVVADTVWARGLAGPDTKMEIREARLRGTVEVHRGPGANEQSGSDVTADKVDLTGQGENKFLIRAHGTPGKPALVVSDSFKIEGPQLPAFVKPRTPPGVDGPGRVDTRPRGGDARRRPGPDRARAPGQSQADGGHLEVRHAVRWPADRHRRQAPAGARPVRVGRGRHHRRGPDRGAVRRLPRPAHLALRHRREEAPSASSAPTKDVEISNVKRDPRTGLLLEYDRINGQKVTYWAPGGFQVDGAGIVRIYGRSGAESGLNPAAGRRPAQPSGGKLAPLQLTRVDFRKAMLGRFMGPADNPADGERIGQFWGDVKVLHAKVADEKADLTEDRMHPPDDMVALHSQYLWVDNLPGPGDKNKPDSSRTRLLARGDGQAALARTYGKEASTIEGDRITYHTDTAQFLVVGENGRDVVIARSNGLGQPVTGTESRQVLYNARTGATRAVDLSYLSMFEPKTGLGTGFVPAPNRQPDPIKPLEMPQRMGDKGTKERRSFNGTTR
ncbi:MAG: hypothetical protein U0800_15565 [Isosphaeraceae bacterium]